jgi:hypothetical protein
MLNPNRTRLAAAVCAVLFCVSSVPVAVCAVDSQEVDIALAHKDYAALPALAHAAKAAADLGLADRIAGAYKDYLETLDDQSFFTKANMRFVREFEKLFDEEGSRGRFFKYCYSHPHEADEALDFPGAADGYARYVISQE